MARRQTPKKTRGRPTFYMAARNAGQKAYDRGLPLTANPYRERTIDTILTRDSQARIREHWQFIYWREGWHDQEKQNDNIPHDVLRI